MPTLSHSVAVRSPTEMSPSSGPKIVALAPNAPEPARLRAKFDSVGRKLALGFAIVVSLLLLLTITAYVGLIGAQRSEALIVEHNIANLQGILQLRANLEAERLDVLLLFEASPTDRAPRLADLRLRTVADRTIVAGGRPPLPMSSWPARSILPITPRFAPKTFSASR